MVRHGLQSDLMTRIVPVPAVALICPTYSRHPNTNYTDLSALFRQPYVAKKMMPLTCVSGIVTSCGVS